VTGWKKVNDEKKNTKYDNERPHPTLMISRSSECQAEKKDDIISTNGVGSNPDNGCTIIGLLGWRVHSPHWI